MYGNWPNYKLMQQKHVVCCRYQNSCNWHVRLKEHWQRVCKQPGQWSRCHKTKIAWSRTPKTLCECSWKRGVSNGLNSLRAYGAFKVPPKGVHRQFFFIFGRRRVNLPTPPLLIFTSAARGKGAQKRKKSSLFFPFSSFSLKSSVASRVETEISKFARIIKNWGEKRKKGRAINAAARRFWKPAAAANFTSVHTYSAPHNTFIIAC